MKTIIILVIVLFVVVGGYMVFKDSKTAEAPADVTSEMPVPAADKDAAPEIVVNTEKIITYADGGYSPAGLAVRVGDTVKFKNNSSKNMWPASAKHPTHGDYPTTGGCLGSTFDACRGVLPGESWSFKFDFKGDWKYHDHLTPKFFGSITVE